MGAPRPNGSTERTRQTTLGIVTSGMPAVSDLHHKVGDSWPVRLGVRHAAQLQSWAGALSLFASSTRTRTALAVSAIRSVVNLPLSPAITEPAASAKRKATA